MKTTFTIKPLLAGILLMIAGLGSAAAGESIYLCKQADGSETLSNLPEGGKCELLMAGTAAPAVSAAAHGAARPAEPTVLARAMPAQATGEGRGASAAPNDAASEKSDKEEKDKDKQGKGDGSDSSWGSDGTNGRYGMFVYGAPGGTAATAPGSTTSGATSGATGSTTTDVASSGTTTPGTTSGGATSTAGGAVDTTAGSTTGTPAIPDPTQTASSGSSPTTPLDTKLQNVKTLMVSAATNPGSGPAWVNAAVSRRYLMVNQAAYRAQLGLAAIQ